MSCSVKTDSLLLPPRPPLVFKMWTSESLKETATLDLSLFHEWAETGADSSINTVWLGLILQFVFQDLFRLLQHLSAPTHSATVISQIFYKLCCLYRGLPLKEQYLYKNDDIGIQVQSSTIIDLLVHFYKTERQ